jgi:hypothetical protein
MDGAIDVFGGGGGGGGGKSRLLITCTRFTDWLNETEYVCRGGVVVSVVTNPYQWELNT